MSHIQSYHFLRPAQLTVRQRDSGADSQPPTRGRRQIFCNFYNMSSSAQGVIINVSIIYQSCRKVLSASCSRLKWNMILTVQTVRLFLCLSVYWVNFWIYDRIMIHVHGLNTLSTHTHLDTLSTLEQAEQKWLVVCALKYAMKNCNYFYF